MAVSTFKPPDDGRLVRRQDQDPPRKRIPGSITVEHFLQITRFLERILKDIDDALRALQISRKEPYTADDEPKELHIRLNESDKPFPLPIFVGWVESDDVRKTREKWNHPQPGLHRFGDDVYSEIYGEALNYANIADERFRQRDWNNQKWQGEPEILDKRAGEKATDPKAGNKFQTCLAMVIDGLATGTLVVGFRHRPNPELLNKTHEVLEQWAREEVPKSAPERNDLIAFLQREFQLGGPHLDKSNWWDFIPKP
jgi:hypothetical protein